MNPSDLALAGVGGRYSSALNKQFLTLQCNSVGHIGLYLYKIVLCRHEGLAQMYSYGLMSGSVTKANI